jgi:hypothetical protein
VPQDLCLKIFKSRFLTEAKKKFPKAPRLWTSPAPSARAWLMLRSLQK